MEGNQEIGRWGGKEAEGQDNIFDQSIIFHPAPDWKRHSETH